jgi:hypothetical protein
VKVALSSELADSRFPDVAPKPFGLDEQRGRVEFVFFEVLADQLLNAPMVLDMESLLRDA